jgi:hypothetical protein
MMLDKLTLTAPDSDLTKEIASRLLSGHFSHCSYTSTKFHHEVVIFHKSRKEVGGHLISIHLQPRFSTTSELKVEINPSHFSSFGAMKKILELVSDPNDLRITRIDHAVDISGFSVNELHSRLIFSRKKVRELYKNGVDLESLYLGQPPERLLIYNKTLQEGSSGVLKARIELQQYREKVPHVSLRNLADYQSYKPFERLKFQTVLADPSDPLSQRKCDELNTYFLTKGAQATFKALNRHSNFKRDYSHILKPDVSVPNLDEIYQENLRTYFQEETL